MKALALALLALGLLVGLPYAATIPVANLAAMAPALKAAQPGDILQLAPGEYRNLSIGGFVNTGVPITIQGQPGVILTGNPKIANSSGLSLMNLEINTAGGTDANYAIRVTSVQRFGFINLDVHGGDAASEKLTAILVRTSSQLAIVNSKFHNTGTAISELNNTDVLISNNSFSELAGDGIDNGGSSKVSIIANNFTAFRAPVGFHTDCIQFWTTNEPGVASDIVVTDNVYFEGHGNPAQGVFMNDEAGNLPYHNVTIARNTIIGGLWNAVYLKAATGVVTITDNVLETWPQPDNATANGPVIPLKAWIYTYRLDGATLTETGNSAQAYTTQTHPLPTPPGNALIGPVTDNGAAAMKAWLRTEMAGLLNLSDDFAAALTTPR